MSDNRSWRRSSRSYHEDASILVKRLVGILRFSGDNTESALGRLAPALRSTRRRMRTFFYDDGLPVVTREEITQLRRQAAVFFFDLGIHHRKMAAKCEAEAEALQRETQLEFWNGAECHGNAGPHGRIAGGRR